MIVNKPLVLIASTLLFAQLAFFLPASALPLYLHNVGAPTYRIGLDVGAGSVASLLLTLAAAPILNRGLTRHLLMTGASLYLLAGFVMLILPFEASLVAGRILQGAGSALVGPSAYAAIPLLAPRRPGSAMGIISSVGSAPLAIGPAIGLLLYSQYGSPWLFIPTMAMGALGALIALALKMPIPNPVERDKLRERQRLWRATGFRRRWTAPLIANIANGVYYGAILAYLPLFLATIHGPNAGIFFTADAIGVVLLRWPAGLLADRTSPIVPMLIGLLLTLAGLAAFAPSTTVVWLVLAGAGTGIGAGLFANGILTEMTALSTQQNRGGAMALTFATATFGGFLGSAISGLLYRPIGFAGIIVFGAIVEAAVVPVLLVAGWVRLRGATAISSGS
jgi:MFS family permease